MTDPLQLITSLQPAEERHEIWLLSLEVGADAELVLYTMERQQELWLPTQRDWLAVIFNAWRFCSIKFSYNHALIALLIFLELHSPVLINIRCWQQ